MTEPACDDFAMLIQADLDGEVSVTEAASVARHLETCVACRALRADLAALSACVRAEAPRYQAPATLAASVAALPYADARPRRSALPFAASGLGGFAMGAVLVFALLLPRGQGGAEDLVASHIRALQPGHLTDVISTDQPHGQALV